MVKIKKILKNYKIAFLCFTMMMFLSSCAYLPVEKLMKPPKLTKEQSSIYTALEKAVGTSDIKLKYPKSGKNRSAFVFYDLDNDGIDEAIAFYQTNNSNITRINILDVAPNNVWYSRDDMAGGGTDVDFIDFIEMDNSDETIHIVIGWEDNLEVLNHATVFSYVNHEITEEFKEDYTNVVIDDIDNDEKPDVILMLYGRSYGNADAMMIGQYKDGIDIVSQFHLNDNITYINQVKVGQTAEGKTAIFIDETVDRSYYTTEVIGIENGELTNFLDNFNKYDYDDEEVEVPIISPNRSIPVLCKDIDYDGVLEVPTTEEFPGYKDNYNNLEEEILYMTTYYKVSENSLISGTSFAINTNDGYSIKLPDKWIGNVTVVKQPETGEWRFVPYNNEEITDSTSPLLRLQVYSLNDYRDKFDIDNFKLLMQKGNFEYYYAIPDQENILSIDENQLKMIFSLTN